MKGYKGAQPDVPWEEASEAHVYIDEQVRLVVLELQVRNAEGILTRQVAMGLSSQGAASIVQSIREKRRALEPNRGAAH